MSQFDRCQLQPVYQTLEHCQQEISSENYKSLKKNFVLNLILDRGEGREKREVKKHHCVVASYMPRTEDLACNPGMCPDWESNQRPFGSQASAQSTEPHQPGQQTTFDMFDQSQPLLHTLHKSFFVFQLHFYLS